MNNTSNPNPLHSPDHEGAHQSCATQAAHCVLEPLRSAFHEGAHRAKAAADKAVPKIKAAASQATYLLGFGVSFATVFSCTVIKELAPEVLKAGCHDGAWAGRKTAENLASRLKNQPRVDSAEPGTGNA